MFLDIAETIKLFFESAEMKALAATAISFLTANLGTIIIFAIKYIGLKKQDMKNKLSNDEIMQAVLAKYGSTLEEYEARIDGKLDDVVLQVTGEVRRREAEKEKLINEETIDLQKAIEATKVELNSNKSIDDILEDK